MRKLKLKKKKKVLLLALSIFTTSFLIGLHFGKAYSPDYNRQSTVDTYLAIYSYWTKIDDTHGELSLRVDDRNYRYKTGDQTITIEPLSI